MATYKLPEALVVRDDLPLTAGEKIDRRALVAEIVAVAESSFNHSATNRSRSRH